MNNVRYLREQRGMTQEEFAEYCDIPRISLARYESGKQISRENAQKIALKCKVSIDFVLGLEPSPDVMQDDAWAIRERLRRDPAYRLLFDAADNASSEHLRAAAAMLKALEPKEGDGE